jgi:ATP-dependent HslUV protease ATP-binding subunit HslU
MLARVQRVVSGSGVVNLAVREGRKQKIAGSRSFCAASAEKKPPSVTVIEVEQPDEPEPIDLNTLTPTGIVKHLDRYIVGQEDAKRAVAIAMRNRWRRHRVPDILKDEIAPKNILMIGPTGCGKTEIARRLAKLADAPFIKVEATKFTEVGFHGRDVDQIIRDLVEISLKQTRNKMRKDIQEEVEKIVDARLLDGLCGKHSNDNTRESFQKLLREGMLDDRIVEIDVPNSPAQQVDGASAAVNEVIIRMDKGMGGNRNQTQKRNMTVSDARPLITDVEVEKMLNPDLVNKAAIQAVEQDGVVFLDEIDKICNSSENRHGADASAEGVQRDLLPLIEGCSISTKHGNVNTDFILFIASGAFHSVKPSDLLAELQGRLPIRVQLQGLSSAELHRILTEPETNLIFQQKELLATEGVSLEFDDDAIVEIANIGAEVNRTIENIGARRLHTVIEKLVEKISFEAADMEDGTTITITKQDVSDNLGSILKKADLQKYVL